MAEAAMLEVAEKPFDVDFATLRRLAGVLPGALPTAINGIRFAASVRPRKFVTGGSDESPVTMPRTAFQVVYPDSTVMLDAGMDKATHDSFGGSEPYFPDQFEKLQRALDMARLIVFTHHHADHVAGVLTAANFETLAAKTLISAETARCLVETPHRPHLKLESSAIGCFIVHDYPRLCPVAPGMVLIKAPGHSVDSQMVYIRLESGREILHSVDSAWNMDNVRLVKPKAAPWVKENVPQVMGELRWLKRLSEQQPEVTVIVTHDDDLFEALRKSGSIGELKI